MKKFLLIAATFLIGFQAYAAYQLVWSDEFESNLTLQLGHTRLELVFKVGEIGKNNTIPIAQTIFICQMGRW